MVRRVDEGALESLPNIGVEVAARLREAGISTVAELAGLGSVDTACRLAAARPDDPPCRSMLSGLEGAIRGVRWHTIPTAEREELWIAYRQRLSRSAGPPSE
jgi:DNA transformation protein